MWKKIAVATVLGTTIIGSGGAALAASSSGSTPTPAPTSTSGTTAKGSTAKGHHHGDRLVRALHAQWVTHDKKKNTDVTHDEIKGMVTAVSATSITVKASDGVTETYTVGSATKLHAKGDSKTGPGTIAQVKTGDRAVVVGTGTSTLTATRVVDHGVPSTAATPKPAA